VCAYSLVVSAPLASPEKLVGSVAILTFEASYFCLPISLKLLRNSESAEMIRL
jgi:hypothetical protein